MKLRGLRPFIFIIFFAGLLVAVNLWKKSRNSESSNDIKSQKTSENGASPKSKTLKDVIAGNLKKQDEFVERKDFDDSVLAQERFYTEAEINEMTEEKFAQVLQETESKLPRISDIKKLPPGALHRTPAPVLQAGKDLGLIKEILNVHESFESLALPFYNNCAKNTDRPTPVRALCLTNFVQIKKKNGEKINTSAYPEELIKLTRMITDL